MRRLWQWLKKILCARKPKRIRPKNSLYLPVIINEYENRPQITDLPVNKKTHLLAGSLFSKPAFPRKPLLSGSLTIASESLDPFSLLVRFGGIAFPFKGVHIT